MENNPIPNFVLGIELQPLEDEVPISLSKLIDQTTDEPIIRAEYIIGDHEGKNIIQRFSAWTETSILVLVHTAHGAFLLKHDRNP